MQTAFRQDGAVTGRVSSREKVDPCTVTDEDFGAPEIQRTAARKIADFFKSSKDVRRGLPLDCPICRAAMVVRIRGRDDRAFLGCSRFPQCSGSWDVPCSAQEEAKQWERQLMTSAHANAMLPSRHDSEMTAMADEVADQVYCQMQESLREGIPPGRITEIRGGSAYAGKHVVGKVAEMANKVSVDVFVDENVKPEDVVDKLPKKRGKVAMKEAVDEAMTDAPSNSLKARLARSAKKAPYRVARMRALTEGRKAILAALKPRVQPATFDLVEAFLDTDAGQGAIIGLIGLAGPYTPKLGQNEHVQAICEEFLDEGVAKGANEVFGLLGMILEPVLKSVMSSIPEVNEIADKVVPKRRKKRVAPDVRVQTREAEAQEEEEEVEPRPKNALRAIPSR